MVLVTESRRVNSLHFKQERRVIHLHDKGMSCRKIRLKVKNRLGKHPSKDLVATTVRDFDCEGGETCEELRTTQMKVPDVLQDPLAPLDS